MPCSAFASAICGSSRRRCPPPKEQSLNPNRLSRQRRTKMEVILLERVAKLGQMGEVVKVRDGFARNFLLKRGKALRATADNRAKFDGMKTELEARNLQAKGEASKVAEKIDGHAVVIIRQASETGQLFGSVSVRDIVTALAADGVIIGRTQVWLDAPIKTIGLQKVTIAVHPEIETSITVTVARSADEAERIKRGEDITSRQEDQDAAAEALAAAGEFFDPEAEHDEVAQPTAEETEKQFLKPIQSERRRLSAGLRLVGIFSFGIPIDADAARGVLAIEALKPGRYRGRRVSESLLGNRRRRRAGW